MNPEAHPSPYEDPKRKKRRFFRDTFLLESNLASAPVLNTGFSGSKVTGGPTLGIVSADYASSEEDFSDTEDVENPSFSMFCQGLRTFFVHSRVMSDKTHLKDINRMIIPYQ